MLNFVIVRMDNLLDINCLIKGLAMVIDLQFRHLSVNAIVKDGKDILCDREELLTNDQQSKWWDAAYQSMEYFGKKMSLSNVKLINLTVHPSNNNVEIDQIFGVLDQDIARSLDMPCVPIFCHL